MDLHSKVFENGVKDSVGPSYAYRGLKVGGTGLNNATGTLGTNHDISIGASTAGNIDSFTQKGILEWKFNPRQTDSTTTLVSTPGHITNSTSATLATVLDGTQFAVNQHIRIDSEILKVTAINSAILTVERGAYGTTAATHTGTPVVSHIAVPEKRENIFCSARIISSENNRIVVDDTSICKLNANEEFIVYKYDDSHASPTYEPRICKVISIDGEDILLDIDIQRNSDTNDLLISPYRYWMMLEIMNIGGETTKTATTGSTTSLTLSDVDGLKVFQQIKDTQTYIGSIVGNVLTTNVNHGITTGDVVFETGSWQGNNSTKVRKYLPERSYSNVVGISEIGTYGTTLNESLYNDGAYINRWNLEGFEKSEESAIILKDYGFGDYDEEKQLGGHCGFLPLNIQGDTSKYKEIDVSKVIQGDSVDFEDTLTLIISVDDPQENFKINVDTEIGPNPLYITSILEDELMGKPTLSVAPNKDNAFYPEFKWSTPSKSAWYGFLHIDDKNIYNQYNNAVVHYPLNESGSHGTTASAPIEEISGISTHISGPLYNVEGLAGYALDFDGSNDYIKCGTPTGGNFGGAGTNDPTSTATTEMSVVTHFVPDSGGADDRYVIAQEETGGRKFSIKLNSSNNITARVYRAEANHVELTSSSIIPTDGEIPTNVILTVDTTLTSGNVKLFINGKLEDTTGAALAIGTTNNWQKDATMQSENGYIIIGNSSHSDETLDSSFDGKIEEIVIYDKCIYPVTPNVTEFLLLKPMSELATGQSLAQSKSHTAKIFIKDYHNIRGSTENDVASSSQVSWRKASFALDTT